MKKGLLSAICLTIGVGALAVMCVFLSGKMSSPAAEISVKTDGEQQAFEHIERQKQMLMEYFEKNEAVLTNTAGGLLEELDGLPDDSRLLYKDAEMRLIDAESRPYEIDAELKSALSEICKEDGLIRRVSTNRDFFPVSNDMCCVFSYSQGTYEMVLVYCKNGADAFADDAQDDEIFPYSRIDEHWLVGCDFRYGRTDT